MTRRIPILIYIFLIAFNINGGHKAFGQDTTDVQKGVFVSVDVLRPVLNFYNKDIERYEFGFGIHSYKKYNPAFDFGFANAEFLKSTYSMEFSGFYTKLGFDKVMMQEGKDMLCFGFRLAGSKYNIDYRDAYINDIYFDSIQVDPGSFQPLAFWAEALFRLNLRLTGNLGFGWAIRFKFPLYMQKDDYFKPFYVPGYGKRQSDAMLGFNYYIYYNLPF